MLHSLLQGCHFLSFGTANIKNLTIKRGVKSLILSKLSKKPLLSVFVIPAEAGIQRYLDISFLYFWYPAIRLHKQKLSWNKSGFLLPRLRGHRFRRNDILYDE